MAVAAVPRGTAYCRPVAARARQRRRLRGDGWDAARRRRGSGRGVVEPEFERLLLSAFGDRHYSGADGLDRPAVGVGTARPADELAVYVQLAERPGAGREPLVHLEREPAS